MKTTFTISVLLLISSSAIAGGPEIYSGDALSGISPSGEWLAGQIGDGSVIIRNRETGDYWIHVSNGGNTNYYIGHGTPVSDTGVVAGSTTSSNAAYWENGKWTVLRTPHPGYISNAISITPDGSVICGGVGGAAMGGDTEETMLFPALWYRQADGGYGEPFLLPHPETDLTGRAPQYITAITISADGKTVGGQIRDYTGLMHEPLVYRCDDNGEWSCIRLGVELLNPNGMEFPEWPGGLDDVVMPSQEWFMEQEQIDAFVEAMNAWDYTGRMPRYEDYMTPEQIEAYNEAVKEYLEIAIPWEENYNKFMEAYLTYSRTGASFGFNSGRLSPDGKIYVTNGRVSKNGRQRNCPVIFKLETGETELLDTNVSTNITYVSSDYTILGYASTFGGDTGTIKAYIYPQMQPGGMYLEDYVEQHNPYLFDWMERHLVQDVIIGLGTETLYETEEMFCTGIPMGTPDMKYILTNNSTASWYEYDGDEYISALLDMDYAPSGVDVIEPAESGSIRVTGNGTLTFDGEYRDVEIYDLSGKCVYRRGVCVGVVDPGLAQGVYIILGEGPQGKVRMKVGM